MRTRWRVSRASSTTSPGNGQVDHRHIHKNMEEFDKRLQQLETRAQDKRRRRSRTAGHGSLSTCLWFEPHAPRADVVTMSKAFVATMTGERDLCCLEPLALREHGYIAKVRVELAQVVFAARRKIEGSGAGTPLGQYGTQSRKGLVQDAARRMWRRHDLAWRPGGREAARFDGNEKEWRQRDGWKKLEGRTGLQCDTLLAKYMPKPTT